MLFRRFWQIEGHTCDGRQDFSTCIACMYIMSSRHNDVQYLFYMLCEQDDLLQHEDTVICHPVHAHHV